jgi:hypothetical protein
MYFYPVCPTPLLVLGPDTAVWIYSNKISLSRLMLGGPDRLKG